MPKNKTLRGRYELADADRQVVLERARMCAAMCKPWVLPPLEHKYRGNDHILPQNFQSIASRGVTNLEGRMLMGLYSPMTPWVKLDPAAQIRLDPNVDPAQLEQFQSILFTHELMIQSVLESANRNSRNPTGFRTAKRSAISQLLITGDVLERMNDDYSITVIRRDRYINKVDDNCSPIFHGVHEFIDPLTMSDEDLEKVRLVREEMEEKDYEDRKKDLYTFVDWQPVTRKWLIRQEVNGEIFNEYDEKVSPYFWTPFEFVAGEDYGHGFIEQNIGDIWALDSLRERLLDFAVMASKFHPCIQSGSEVKPEDLLTESGTVIPGCNIQGGVVQDVAFLQVNKVADFQVVRDTVDRLESSLGGAMLLASDAVRNSERTTAFEVQQTTVKELEGALGGFYAPIADRQQIPLVQYTRYKMEKDKLLPPLPDESVEVQVLTGIAALSRIDKANNLLGIIDVMRQLGPEVMARVNMDKVVDVLLRYRGIHEPGILKSPEQVQQERQEMLALMAQQEAQSKAIDVAGNAVESSMTKGQQ